MPKLTSEQQKTIVLRLACYASATEIQAELKERWELKLSYSQISYYDPLSAQGSVELDAKWKDLFWKTREAHDKVLAQVPIAKQQVRLMVLNRVAMDPVRGMTKLGLKAVEQAAKETGGLYTRPRPSDSSPDSTDEPEDLSELTAEELALLEAIRLKLTASRRHPGGTGQT